jgi:hypothetical protein
MNKGIIYLIQPAELIGTNRYKIGMSNNPDLDRCKNGYLKGSRYICIMECINPLEIEKYIRDEFTKKFKLIAGKEYFEGIENDMLYLFVNIIFKNMNIIQIETKNNNELEKDNIKIDEDNYDVDIIIDNINNKYLSNNYINYLQSLDNKNDDIKYNILHLLLNYNDLKILAQTLNCIDKGIKVGTTKDTFAKCILEKNNVSIIIDLINVHFNKIYNKRIIEINKFSDYKFYWELNNRNDTNDIYIDDTIYTEKFIKYGIIHVDYWYYRYDKLYNKIIFTDKLIKFIIKNDIYGFLYIYTKDIEQKYYNIKISEEIWEYSIEYLYECCADLNKYYKKMLPKNVIKKIKKFNKNNK